MKNNKTAQNDVYDIEKGSISAESEDCTQNCEQSRHAEKQSKKEARRAKKQAKWERGSFIALLVRSFVSFSLIIILGVVTIFSVVSWAVNDAARHIGEKTILEYVDELVQGKYSAVPSSRLFGKKGWLDIVDTKGNVVYSTRTEVTKYSAGELDAIQKFEKNTTLTVHEFKMVDDKSYCLITRTFVDDSGAKQEQFMLLDYNHNVIEHTIPTNKDKYNDLEFVLLTYDATHDGKTLNKITFTAQDGNSYYAVFLDTNERGVVATYVFVIIVVLAIVALFALVMFLYVKYLSKHVQKPLVAMTDAMTAFAGNDYHTHVDYKGSVEFEQLCDAFNEMVDLLGASEKQRVALEQDKQRMLAGLSHDLKTPITIIQGFAKAINDGLVSDEDKQKYLQIILTKSAQMSELINQFYEYNKLEHPDFALDKKPRDVAEMARTFLAGIYDEFDLGGYNLDTDITEEPLVCDVDEQNLRRVFGNLTGNFFKYTPKGTTLFVEAQREGDFAVVRFMDNGPGIKDEDIFEAFVVGEKSRNKQGSGLGLAVCKRIVDMHGGEIFLSKTPKDNFNTEFVIRLPLVKQGDQKEQTDDKSAVKNTGKDNIATNQNR